MKSTSAVSIRAASPDDASAIANIYNQGIRERIATFETEERHAAERLAWLSDRDERHPVIVATRENQVIGWASLSSFNPRDAYRFVADISVYVDRHSRGTGVGKVLLLRLIELAKSHDYHKLVLAGFPWNESAIGLYQAVGFREIGVYREQGLLDGKWVDTVIMELLLHESD